LKNIKKLVTMGLIAAIMSSTFVGCSNGSSSSSASSTEATSSAATKEKVTLTLATNRTDMADTTLKDLAAQYNKENPNVTVQVEAIKDTDNVLKTRIAAGEQPDVAPIPNGSDVKDFPLYYAPLDDLGFTDANLFSYKLGVSSADNKLYGLNSSVNYTGIIYNKKAFQTAGIDKAPTTMDEFYADCAKLKDKGIVPFASNFKDKWPLNIYSADFVLPVSQTGNPDYKNTLATKDLLSDADGLLYSFNFLRTMKTKGYLEADLMSTNWDSMKKDQATGKIAMAYLGTWYPPQVIQNGAAKEDIGMFPFPGIKALPIGGDYLFGVAKTSKHVAEAKAFLKWMWTDSKYAKAVSVASPLKDAKADDPAIAELTSFKLPNITANTDSAEVTRMFKDSQIDLVQALQDYMVSNDPASVIKNYNAKWNAVKSK
jgi:raffinose/stachyose/melibiose transport system substrate-binding protein